MNLMDQAVEFVNQVQRLEENEVSVFVNELAKEFQFEVGSEEYISVKNAIDDIRCVA